MGTQSRLEWRRRFHLLGEGAEFVLLDGGDDFGNAILGYQVDRTPVAKMRVEADEPLARRFGWEMQQQPTDHEVQGIDFGLVLPVGRLVGQPARDARPIDPQDARDLALPTQGVGQMSELRFGECRGHASHFTATHFVAQDPGFPRGRHE